MMKQTITALLALSLGAHPVLAGPMEVPKLNPKVGTGLPAAGAPAVSSPDNGSADAAVVPTLGGGSLIVPDAVIEGSARRLASVSAGAAVKSPAPPSAPLPSAAPSPLVPTRRPITAPAAAAEKADAPADPETPQLGSERMREALESLTDGNAKIRETVSRENPSADDLRQAGITGSAIFDGSGNRAQALSTPETAPQAPRRRNTAAAGLLPPLAASESARPEPDSPARDASHSTAHSRLSRFFGKAVYYMTAGSYGVIPRTFGKTVAGEPLVVLERRAVPFSRLLPRKLRHALFGRHWISIAVNAAPDFAAKRELLRAFQSLGEERTLDELQSGWAGGVAGYRAITANPALLSLAARNRDSGWKVLDYRSEATLGDRLQQWLQHPVDSPAIAARALWAKLRGRAPPADPRRILTWEDPDPEPADRLPLYLLKLPLRFAGAVLREAFGDTAAVGYTVRGLASIFAFHASPKRILSRANAIAFQDPSRVLGVFDDKEIECQTASDCAVRATYNHPLSEPIRRAMDYPAFLNFAEAAVNTPLRATGTSLDRRRAYMDLLGFENGDMHGVAEEQELLSALKDDGPMFGRLHFQGSRLGSMITFQGWNPSSSHLIVINGAIRENGIAWMRHAALAAGLPRTAWELLKNPLGTLRRLRDDGVWTFVITDSNFRVPQRYTYRQLESMGLAIGTLKRKTTWQEGVGFRPLTPVEIGRRIDNAVARYSGVRVPQRQGLSDFLRRAFVGARWRALPSDAPVLVPAARRIELELGGRPWEGGKLLEILAVDIAKRRFDSLRGEPELDADGVTHVLVDPLNPGQFRALKRDGGEFVLGRGNSGRFLLTQKVSRYHLSIIPMGDSFIIEDRNSSNGTRIARVRFKPLDSGT